MARRIVIAVACVACLGAASAGALTPGLTPDFVAWLDANGYSGYSFERADVVGGSYGGRELAGQTLSHQPVIFIHGNADSALGHGPGLTGWSDSIEYFLSQGYSKAELYATTWGPADVLETSLQYHSRAYLEYLQAFVEAVLDYTGADQVDIISHSMGVTLARKVVKGGPGNDLAAGGAYDLGPALTARVDTFVGISGGNLGLASCYYTGPTTPSCGSTNGFYPGYMVGWWGPYGVSNFLVELNSSSGYEGDRVYTIWSQVDEVIGYGCIVWGSYTTRIPGQDGEKRFTSYPYGHVNSKDLTGYYQLRMVRDHVAY